MTNPNPTSKVFSALLLGAFTGATLSVLFAPRKGRKSHAMIINSTSDLTENLKQKIKGTKVGIQKSEDNVLAKTNRFVKY